MADESDTMLALPILGRLLYREWHAFIDGVYCGVTNSRVNEYGREKHYWRAGWLFGRVVLFIRSRVTRSRPERR